MQRNWRPLQPAQSRILQQKWDSEQFRKHEQRVLSVKSSIDTTPPAIYPHLELRMKKLKLEEDRAKKIDRENRILLEKMSEIMNEKRKINKQDDYGRVRNLLNAERKERENVFLERENEAIARRLAEVKPFYDRKCWQREFEAHVAHQHSIAVFPRNEDEYPPVVRSSSCSSSGDSQLDAWGNPWTSSDNFYESSRLLGRFPDTPATAKTSRTSLNNASSEKAKKEKRGKTPATAEKIKNKTKDKKQKGEEDKEAKGRKMGLKKQKIKKERNEQSKQETADSMPENAEKIAK